MSDDVSRLEAKIDRIAESVGTVLAQNAAMSQKLEGYDTNINRFYEDRFNPLVKKVDALQESHGEVKAAAESASRLAQQNAKLAQENAATIAQIQLSKAKAVGFIGAISLVSAMISQLVTWLFR